jgi:hypothetical protein
MSSAGVRRDPGLVDGGHEEIFDACPTLARLSGNQSCPANTTFNTLLLYNIQTYIYKYISIL